MPALMIDSGDESAMIETVCNLGADFVISVQARFMGKAARPP
jgi:hypothetical protein